MHHGVALLHCRQVVVFTQCRFSFLQYELPYCIIANLTELHALLSLLSLLLVVASCCAARQSPLLLLLVLRTLPRAACNGNVVLLLSFERNLHSLSSRRV